jgi:hypothetical protein
MKVCSRFGLGVMVAIPVVRNLKRKPFKADAKAVWLFLIRIPELVLFIPRFMGYA